MKVLRFERSKWQSIFWAEIVSSPSSSPPSSIFPIYDVAYVPAPLILPHTSPSTLWGTTPPSQTFQKKGLLELEKLCQRKTSFKEVIKQGQPLSDIRIQHSRSQNGIYVFYYYLAPSLLADNRSSSSSSLWVSVIIIIIIFILSNLSVVKLKIELNQKLEEI